MAYAFQTFGSGQVLTKGQEQQVEDNIRDHVHGQNGVGAAGLNWAVGSATSSFQAVASMSGTLWQVAGDFTITTDAPATLGKGWAQTYVNIGSGRIVIKPGAGTIDNGNSQFVLTPGCQINAFSDGANINLFGQAVGWFTLFRKIVASSLHFVTIDKLFPGDFNLYEIRADDVLISSGHDYFKAFVSNDSGSSFTVAGYQHDTVGDTVNLAFTQSVVTSNQMLQMSAVFTNNAVAAAPIFFDTYNVTRGNSGALNPNAVVFEHAAAPITSTFNALQVLPGSRGFMTAGTISLRGRR